MEVNIDHKSKTVEIWLNTLETQDPVLKEQLRSFYQVYIIQKYMLVIFRSGKQDLVQCTSDLLCYNRKRIARLEVEREKQMGLAT